MLIYFIICAINDADKKNELSILFYLFYHNDYQNMNIA